jgi:hypothetical protein
MWWFVMLGLIILIIPIIYIALCLEYISKRVDSLEKSLYNNPEKEE